MKTEEEIREHLNNVEELKLMYLKNKEILKLLNVEDGYTTIINTLKWVLEDKEDK